MTGQMGLGMMQVVGFGISKWEGVILECPIVINGELAL